MNDAVKHLKDLFNHFKDKFKKKADTDEGDAVEPEKDPSDLSKGDKGKIMGVSKPIVVGIAIVTGLILFIALYEATATPTQQQGQNTSNQKIASGDEADGLPSNYETALAQRNKNRGKDGQDIETPPKGEEKPTPANANPPRSTSTPMPPVPAIHREVPAPVASTPYIAQPIATPPQAVMPRPQPQPQAQEETPKPQAAPQAPKQEKTSPIALIGGDATKDSDKSDGQKDKVTYTPPQEGLLAAGTSFPIRLLSNAGSGLETPVRAQVLTDVYDNLGQSLILPAGSILMGKAGTPSTEGTVPLTFSSITPPSGGTWSIGERIVATVQGSINRHAAEKIRGSIINSAIASLTTSGADRVYLTGDAISSILGGTQNEIADTVTVSAGQEAEATLTEAIQF